MAIHHPVAGSAAAPPHVDDAGWQPDDRDGNLVRWAASYGGATGAAASLGVCAGVGAGIGAVGAARGDIPTWVPVLAAGAAVILLIVAIILQRRLDSCLGEEA